MPQPSTSRQARSARLGSSADDTQLLRLARAVAVLLGVLLLGLSVSRLVYPFDTGRFEAFIWLPAGLAISGENPYGFTLTPPFVMAPYGIVYYLLIGLGTKIFGLQLWFGRLASVVAAVVCLVCIWRITSSLTSGRRALWFGAIAFMASFPLQSWLAIQRADLISLALAFIAIALTFTTNWEADGPAPRIALVILLLVASFFTKQTTILPVAIVAVRFWQLRGGRWAVLVLTGFVVLVLVMILFLNYSSAGGYVWQHWTHARRLPVDPSRLLSLLRTLATVPATWVVAGTCLLALYPVGTQQKLRRFENPGKVKWLPSGFSAKRLIVLYLILAVAFALITSARSGSNINYFLEASIVASIVFGLSLKRIAENSRWRGMAATIILLLAVSSLWQLMRVARGEYFRWRSQPYFIEMSDTVERLTPGAGVCISVFPELVTRVGRTFHFDDYGEYNDGFSPELHQVFREGIASRRYAAILWESDHANFPGYRLVPMKRPPPTKVYSIYLYVREP